MQNKNLEFKVGVFVAIGLLVLGFMILKLGNREFKETYKIVGLFDYTGGVVKGGPVRCAGVEVGKVVDLVLVTEGLANDEVSHVEVVMDIADGVILRDDARVSIQSYGILGEKHIEFTPAEKIDPEAKILKPGDKIKGINPVVLDDLAKEGQEIFKSLRGAAKAIEKVLSDQNVDNISETISNTKNLTADMKLFISRLDNLVANNAEHITKLISRLSDGSAKFKETLDNLDSILVSVKEGWGTAGKLVVDPELYNELTALIKDLRKYGIFYKGKGQDTSRSKHIKGYDSGGEGKDAGINRGFIR
ncbi:MAG: MCE family protein [Candidatus Aureabacteria bacterium]|nr:MCE family protein [Candidatus Auribacterota bacterium]